MILFVVAVQFVGVFLVFLLFPVILIPFLESRFEERLPRTLPAKLRGYVLIYRYGPAVTSLIHDMKRHRVPTVVLEEDEALARRLRDRGLNVVLSRLEDEDLFRDGLGGARALLANGADHENEAVVLSARESGFEGPIYVFVENPLLRKPIVLAGANAPASTRPVPTSRFRSARSPGSSWADNSSGRSSSLWSRGCAWSERRRPGSEAAIRLQRGFANARAARSW
jgi:hypothetical protein